MSKRILVVEDQPDNRQIIRDMLAPTDYEITEAENGALLSCDFTLSSTPRQKPTHKVLKHRPSSQTRLDVRFRARVLDTLSATAHDA